MAYWNSKENAGGSLNENIQTSEAKNIMTPLHNLISGLKENGFPISIFYIEALRVASYSKIYFDVYLL